MDAEAAKSAAPATAAADENEAEVNVVTKRPSSADQPKPSNDYNAALKYNVEEGGTIPSVLLLSSHWLSVRPLPKGTSGLVVARLSTAQEVP